MICGKNSHGALFGIDSSRDDRRSDPNQATSGILFVRLSENVLW
jgi:hypothetical protein